MKELQSDGRKETIRLSTAKIKMRNTSFQTSGASEILRVLLSEAGAIARL